MLLIGIAADDEVPHLYYQTVVVMINRKIYIVSKKVNGLLYTKSWAPSHHHLELEHKFFFWLTLL